MTVLEPLGLRVPGVPVGRVGRQVVGVEDVLAEVLDADAGLLGSVPEEPVTLVGERVAALRRVGAVEGAELLLDVVVGLSLNDPVVAVGRERALVVEVVEVTEPRRQRVRVRRDLLAELGVGRVAVALAQVTEDLVVAAVLLDDHDDVLDRRVTAQMLRDHRRNRVVGAVIDRLDLIPGVVTEDRLRARGEISAVARHRELRSRCRCRRRCCGP